MYILYITNIKGFRFISGELLSSVKNQGKVRYIVWNVITDDLPSLEPKISALLKELEKSPAHHRPASGKPMS
jgi:hypothetical protein